MNSANSLPNVQQESAPTSGLVWKSRSRHASSSLDEEPRTAQELVKGETARLKRTRRGHKKSRKGCFNCKRARMKCNENHPSCDYCLHRGFHCEWPDAQADESRKPIGNEDWRPMRHYVIKNIIQSSTPVFTMQDFRLFNHFIQSAYPSSPFGNDSIWTHEIPSISSDYDYLLHSMLALSASSLATTQSSTAELQHIALTYRLKAISSLNAVMSIGIQNSEQGNAMLATCYNLFVQSAYIADGLIEFMNFVRGCIIIAVKMQSQDMKFVFHSMWGDEMTSKMNPGLKDAPLIDPDQVNAACNSLEKFNHLCVRSADLEMYGLILGTARALFTSSYDAFMALRKVYGFFAQDMSHEDFCVFTDPTNDVGRLLQSHLVALQVIMKPISRIVQCERRSSGLKNGDEQSNASWLNAIHAKIPSGLEQFYEWPVSVAEEFQERFAA